VNAEHPARVLAGAIDPMIELQGETTDYRT
jgi:hypothetical protein